MILKYLLLPVMVLCSIFCVEAYSPAVVQGYIAKYKDAALQNEKEYGIPATIILAQGILESGAGTSRLTRESNNHFGMKAGSKWKGRVHLAWDDETQKSRFRCYNSAAESFRDHARLLTESSRYRFLFDINIYDYRGWAHGLKKAGYATAPLYAQALIGIIDQYRLYEVNGGVKLRPGKAVTITRVREVEKPDLVEETTAVGEDFALPEEEESDEQNMIASAMKRYAVEINNVHCTVMQPGEDLASISRKYDISPVDLLRYNDVASARNLKEGDIVFLTKKKKRYEGPQDVYITKSGETLHDVSQEFGIQLHQLAKLNNLNNYVRLNEGTRIVLK